MFKRHYFPSSRAYGICLTQKTQTSYRFSCYNDRGRALRICLARIEITKGATRIKVIVGGNSKQYQKRKFVCMYA